MLLSVGFPQMSFAKDNLGTIDLIVRKIFEDILNNFFYSLNHISETIPNLEAYNKRNKVRNKRSCSFVNTLVKHY